MRLLAIRIHPRGSNGWSSPTLMFGKEITELFGPNGSGKTPIVLSIVFCLGHHVKFREDLAEKCEHIELSLDLNGEQLAIKRWINKEFYLEVHDVNGKISEFENEHDYSQFLFSKLQIQSTKLVATNKKPAEAYLATLLPLFYLDQDAGYTSLYRAPNHFIQDQFCEMVRLAFGLPPKNSFDRKKDLLQLKERLGSFDRKIVEQQKLVSDFASEVPDKDKTVDSLQRDVDALKNELHELKSSRHVRNDVQLLLDDMILTKEKALKETTRLINDLTQTKDGIEKIKQDILSEADTLQLNEEARRLFETFADICGRPDCCLFTGSSETYAKNLLYLKDQIKDIDRNADFTAVKIEQLKAQQQAQQVELEALHQQREANATKDDIGGLVDVIRRVTQQIFELEKEKKTLEILAQEERNYIELLGGRDTLLDRISLLSSSSGQSDLEFKKLRLKLKELTVKWLDILGTKNVSRNISIDNNLDFLFGTEKLGPITGSTKIRIVLAVHAALFEAYLENRQHPFRFLILDTPRQHEMHTADLDNFITALKRLSKAKDAQVIFSTTDYRYVCDEGDMEWAPEFDGVEQMMYLGIRH